MGLQLSLPAASELLDTKEGGLGGTRWPDDLEAPGKGLRAKGGLVYSA